MTQLARVSEARKFEFTTARVTIEPTFVMSGSILAGTAEHRLVSMETHLELEADQEPEAIRAVVDQAERMCFVLNSIQHPHEVQRRSTFNGSPV